LSPKKRERCGGAPLCLGSSRQGGKTALMLGRVNLFGGVRSASLSRRTARDAEGSELIANAAISYGQAVEDNHCCHLPYSNSPTMRKTVLLVVPAERQLHPKRVRPTNDRACSNRLRCRSLAHFHQRPVGWRRHPALTVAPHLCRSCSTFPRCLRASWVIACAAHQLPKVILCVKFADVTSKPTTHPPARNRRRLTLWAVRIQLSTQLLVFGHRGLSVRRSVKRLRISRLSAISWSRSCVVMLPLRARLLHPARRLCIRPCCWLP
jgi:hypothetical protein